MASTNKTFYEQELERLATLQPVKQYQYIQVRQSKAFMDRYYPEKIELDRIAAAACMSRFHYIRLFQQIYGTTPRAYLKDLRIRKAKQLLENNTPVKDACYYVGYASIPTFTNAFKEGFGISPAQYKKQSAINNY